MKPEAIKKLQEIHHLSKKINSGDQHDHEQKLIEMMRHHIEEIEELKEKNDQHYLIETGDLMVLCAEVLLENKIDVSQMFGECLDRFKKKLIDLKSKV